MPGCETRAEAERIWRDTRESAGKLFMCSVSGRRIFALRYRVRGTETAVTIGEPEAVTGELVQVILESEGFLIWTENHGIVRGAPIPAGLPEEVIEFEESWSRLAPPPGPTTR